MADDSLRGACGGFLLFWKSVADKDYHRLPMPNTARDMDLHPDGLQVATAHHGGHVRIPVGSMNLLSSRNPSPMG
jgi:hypothetical protein